MPPRDWEDELEESYVKLIIVNNAIGSEPVVCCQCGRGGETHGIARLLSDGGDPVNLERYSSGSENPGPANRWFYLWPCGDKLGGRNVVLPSIPNIGAASC